VNTIPLDTLKMARKLEAAGFPGAQAAGASEFRLTAAIARVHSDLEVLRRDMTIRLGAMAIASTGVMLAAMRFMLTHP
jgi:hypothetical protein